MVYCFDKQTRGVLAFHKNSKGILTSDLFLKSNLTLPLSEVLNSRILKSMCAGHYKNRGDKSVQIINYDLTQHLHGFVFHTIKECCFYLFVAKLLQFLLGSNYPYIVQSLK